MIDRIYEFLRENNYNILTFLNRQTLKIFYRFLNRFEKIFQFLEKVYTMTMKNSKDLHACNTKVLEYAKTF